MKKFAPTLATNGSVVTLTRTEESVAAKPAFNETLNINTHS